MDDEKYSINMNCVVSGYLNYRIQKAGYEWQTSPTSNCPHNEVMDAVRELCTEFEKNVMAKDKTLVHCGIEVSTDHKNFITVLSELLPDLNWGRIIAALAFSGLMAVDCMSRDRADQVDLIREWTSSFMQAKIEPWIKNNGGWKGLVDFNNRKKMRHCTENGSNKWLAAAGVVGMATIGALLLGRS